MKFETKNVNDVSVVTRKNRTSKYQPLIQAITALEGGKVLVVKCEEDQTAEALRSNLYQALRNQEVNTSTLRLALEEDESGVVISKKEANA